MITDTNTTIIAI